MKKFLISLFWIFNLLAALALLIAYAAPYIDPSLIVFPAFFGLAFPFILLINVAFVLIWFFIKWKYALLSLLLIVLGYSYIKVHVQFFGDRKEPDGKGIKVLTYNVKTFGKYGSKKTKVTADSIFRFLEDQKADIICLQEAGFWKKIKIKGYKRVGKNANFIITKLKVIRSASLLDENDQKFGLYADLLFGNDTVRVYNVQLMSYSVSGDLEQYEEKPDKINPKQKMITIARKLKKGFEMRVPETFKLRKSLENSPYPVILCGDLNDTPVSYTYRQLIKTGLKDAFTESGRGYGNTYNGYLPKIRIDYIFASADYFELYNYHILQTSFSDHFPVSAFIQPVKKQ